MLRSKWMLVVIVALVAVAPISSAQAELIPTDRGQMAYLIAHSSGGMPASPPTEPTFLDVPTDSPWYAEIEYMAALGIMVGYADDRFRAEMVPTRAAAAPYVARAIDLFRPGDPRLSDFVPPTTPSFTDVPSDSWAYTEVEYLVSVGVLPIVHPDRLFRPGDGMDLFVTAEWLAAGGLAYVDPLTVPYRTGTIAGVVSDAGTALCLEAAGVECVAIVSEAGVLLPATTTSAAADGVFSMEARVMTHPVVRAHLFGYYANGQTDVVVLEGRTVEVAFALSKEFGDAGAGSWAYEEVGACVNAGIVSGYDDGLYHSEWAVTRDQMAVYIARALAGGDENVPEPAEDPGFTDVSSEHWAYRHVAYAAAAEIVQGYAEGDYRPADAVDRGQMAVFMARARGWVGLLDDMTLAPELFPDVPTGFWAGAAVQACVEHGVVKGYDDGYYYPANIVTRDQMAVYVARAFEL